MLPQIVSGKHRQATSVLLRLIGHAAEFANLLIGSWRCIGGVGKVRMHCGAQASDKSSFFQFGGKESRYNKFGVVI